MSYADDPNYEPQEVDADTPGWLHWPNVPIIGVTFGTLLGWYRAWRDG